MIWLSSFGEGHTQLLFTAGSSGLSPARLGAQSYLPCGLVEVLNVQPSVVLARIIFNVSTEELCLEIKVVPQITFLACLLDNRSKV